MSEQPTIEVDLILAAIINDAGGFLEISSESLEADYGYSVLDLSYNPDKQTLVIRLMDRDEVVFDEPE